MAFANPAFGFPLPNRGHSLLQSPPVEWGGTVRHPKSLSCGGTPLAEVMVRGPAEPQGAHAPSRHPVYAALDLGTNNCRLLVARPAPGGFSVIDSFSRPTRLGEGLNGSGRLSDAAITRTLDALTCCAKRLKRHHSVHLRAVATEACRKAANSDLFISSRAFARKPALS